MPPAKAHRYLVSLLAGGIVVQDPQTSRYDLGPLALRLGLAAIDRADPLRFAHAELAALRDEIGETVSLITWGDRGPTVRRTEDGPHEVTLTMRRGTLLSAEASATGLLFTAFMTPEAAASGIPAVEAAAKRRRREIDDARRRGMARSIGGVLPGVNALAVPILDAHRRLSAVVVAYGHSRTFDVRWNGEPAKALKRFADRLRSI